MAPDRALLRRSPAPRGRGRPPRSPREWQELCFHRYTMLYPAARAAHRVTRSGPLEHPEAGLPAGTRVPPGKEREMEEHTADWLVRRFRGGPVWLARLGWRRFLRLVYDGPPRRIALVMLARQHGRPVGRVAKDVKASARRHRAGVCLVYGDECWALGGLRASPRSVDGPRWRAILGRFPPPPDDQRPPHAPRRLRLLHP